MLNIDVLCYRSVKEKVSGVGCQQIALLELKLRMKLQMAGTANRRMSNVEPQNIEGWYRCALSFE